MAGIKKIRTRELSDVEKELVAAFRAARWYYLGCVNDNDDMNAFWKTFGEEFNARIERLAKSKG